MRGAYGQQKTKQGRMQASKARTKVVVIDRQFFFNTVEEMQKIDDFMDLVEEQAKDRFVDGFADYVVARGFGARIAYGRKGIRGRTWQSRGREMFGAERFSGAMNRAIQRARSG